MAAFPVVFFRVCALPNVTEACRRLITTSLMRNSVYPRRHLPHWRENWTASVISFKEHPFAPMLGGGFYGLALSRGRQDFVLSWHGLFQDQDEQIKNLYRSVERLAGPPATTVWRTGVYPAGQFPPKDRHEPD